MLRLARKRALSWIAKLPQRHHSTVSRLWLRRQGHWIYYCPFRRQPVFTVEYLSADSIPSPSSQKGRMKEDAELPESIRATQADYKGSGLDRGHMVAAANHKDAQPTNRLSNASPQYPAFNSGIWLRLEIKIRDIIREAGEGIVYTGPAFHDPMGTIGDNQIPIPSHFFKVVQLERGRDLAWLLPHFPKEPGVCPDTFSTTKKKVEKLSGVFLMEHPTH